MKNFQSKPDENLWIRVNEALELRDPHLKIWQIHHGYIGAVMFITGLVVVLGTESKTMVKVFGTIGISGFVIGLDDLIQHIVQHWRSGFRSPINKLYGKIWRARKNR